MVYRLRDVTTSTAHSTLTITPATANHAGFILNDAQKKPCRRFCGVVL